MAIRVSPSEAIGTRPGDDLLVVAAGARAILRFGILDAEVPGASTVECVEVFVGEVGDVVGGRFSFDVEPDLPESVKALA